MVWINLKSIEKVYELGSENEIMIECVVMEFIHKLSKKGNPWAVLGLKDNYGFQRIFLFGEQYQKFKDRDQMLGKQVLISSNCRKKRFSEGFELEINSITELE